MQRETSNLRDENGGGKRGVGGGIGVGVRAGGRVGLGVGVGLIFTGITILTRKQLCVINCAKFSAEKYLI